MNPPLGGSGAPPAVALDPTAVIGRRVVAKIIDYLIFLPAAAIPYAEAVRSFSSRTVADATSYCNAMSTRSHLCMPVDPTTVWQFDVPSPRWYLVPICFWMIVAWLEGHYGWTPGKLAAGIRVIRDTTGRPCGFGRALIRNLLWIVDGIFFGLVAVLVANRSAGHKRLGDNAAGTLVVHRAVWGTPARRADPEWRSDETCPAFPADQPIWDPARAAWITWDTPRAAWLQWDATLQRWEPIST